MEDVAVNSLSSFSTDQCWRGIGQSHENCFEFHIILGGQIVGSLRRAMTKSNQWVGMLFFITVSCLNREEERLVLKRLERLQSWQNVFGAGLRALRRKREVQLMQMWPRKP